MENGGFLHYDSPLGGMTLCSEGGYLVGVSFDGRKRLGQNDAAARESACDPVLEQTAKWLDLYFAGQVPDFTPPVDLRVTPFVKEVCAILRTIPYGQTTTYGKIAKLLAERRGIPRMSAQAVGGAVGRNPVAIIIPCHRVVGAHGALVGYGGGLKRKEELLRLEGNIRRI